MTNLTGVAPVPSDRLLLVADHLLPVADQLRLAVAAYLARARHPAAGRPPRSFRAVRAGAGARRYRRLPHPASHLAAAGLRPRVGVSAGHHSGAGGRRASRSARPAPRRSPRRSALTRKRQSPGSPPPCRPTGTSSPCSSLSATTPRSSSPRPRTVLSPPAAPSTPRAAPMRLLHLSMLTRNRPWRQQGQYAAPWHIRLARPHQVIAQRVPDSERDPRRIAAIDLGSVRIH